MDTTVGLSIVIILITVGFLLGLRPVIRLFSRYRGTKIVTCPETKRPTWVEVDTFRAALTSAFGRPTIQLENCSRWPIKEQCGQECLANLEGAPPECLVNGLLTKWYEKKRCCYCHVTFDKINWIDHQPALRSPSGELRSWREITLENIFGILSTYLPVCWNCYIAQSFVRDHPDLVVYRPGQGAQSSDSVTASQRHIR